MAPRPILSFLELFAAQVERTPASIALEHGAESLTYAELAGRANTLAFQLRAMGVAADQPVGICLPRSLDAIVAILGVLQVGGAYLPLDPAYPRDRLKFMLEDSGAEVLITNPALRVQLPAVANMLEGPFVRNADETAPLRDFPRPTPDQLAYIIYTSGSTGQPKGVLMPHGPLANLLDWQLETLSCGNGRTLQFAPLSFDVHFQEIFGTLAAGGTLVLVDDDIRLDAGRLLDFLESKKIERMFLPFVALHALAEIAENRSSLPSHLREVVTAGEQLQVTRALASFFRKLPHALLHNHYGPSETHVVTSHTLRGPPEDWPALPPIGRPLPGVEVHVLDEYRQRVAAGLIGELYLGGCCLARGYLNRPELTEERFATLPGAGRVYRTGDLVRWNAEGDLDFLGRADSQVKLRGYRIELGEIEVAIASHPGVAHAVATVREDRPGDRRLYAYVQLTADIEAPAASLRSFLLARLPDYMVPGRFVCVEGFARTPSGKIDRKALPAPGKDRPEVGSPYVPPATPEERTLAGLWGEILDLDRIGIDDGFFDLGGTSLLAVHMVERLQRESGFHLSVLDVFQHPTIRSLLASKQTDAGQAGERSLREGMSRAAAPGLEPVAIIGMAGRFPGAPDLRQLWTNLVEGVESITSLRADELDPSIPAALKSDSRYVRARGILDGAEWFDSGFFGISPAEADVMDPQQRVFLELAWEVLEAAGYVPERIRGAVGVFAGVHNNGYFAENVALRPDAIERVGEFQAMVGREKDYVATRVAHRLDLRGPALSIHTACSTSLVAVAQAFHALRTGQCDLAIAGGAAITVPQRSGHLYNEGGMLSIDGRCRPFDADATGTVFSDGAGAVLLKRLPDAIRDGDHIHAVIRGVGLSNDGAEKASFTAPSVQGQAMAIALAHATAGVEPRTISYVEAHGTATPLGDPIEVEALTTAFQLGTDEVGFCRIGSIKSNFGHLTAAAGVTGLIKTALALEHEELPPTLHFTRPNPNIDFDSTPFEVQSTRTPWQRNDAPRRAGVSSFGVGGTNAHVVLEEAPIAGSPGPAAPRQLLVLSARTASALEAASARLAAHMGSVSDAKLPDVAYTLGVGRRAFAHRRALVAGTSEEAASLLRGEGGAGRVVSRKAMARPSEPVWMFPGQGSQSVRMGEALYRGEPVFRAAVDRCALLLQDRLGVDLRSVLYPDASSEAEAAERLRETAITQPALFVVEYALAQLWLAWGIRPSVMVGHSVGEFVAACLAGVFSLEDALVLVAERGRLMQSLPAGSMLSIRAPAAAMEQRLPSGLAIASINAPNLCVVAGPSEDVTAFQQVLEEEEIACRFLQTSHAFHSPMMDPAIAPFEKLVRSIALHAPHLPIVSTVTGELLDEKQATDPRYWAMHLREPVRFSDALRTLLETPDRILLEVGPRSTLATLARQQARGGQLILASLREGSTGDEEWTSILSAAGQLFCAGVPLDFERLHESGRRRRVPLPTYPFERRRHWLDPVATTPTVLPPISSSTEAPLPMNRTESNRIHRLVGELQRLFADTSGLEIDELDASANFLELGFDSLMLTQTALAVSRRYSLPVSFRQLMEEYGSFAALAQHLDGQLPEEAPDASVAQASVPVAANEAVMVAAPPPVPAGALALPAPVVVHTAPVGGAVQVLIQQQLQVMAQQLALLGSAAPVPIIDTSPDLAHVATAPSVMKANSVTNASATLDASPGEESAEPVRYDAKKAFGAIARIHTQRDTGLSPLQQTRLDAFIRRYNARTAGSKAAAQASRSMLADPRVVTGFRPITKELVYPLLVVRSKGPRVWDVDGNEYIDVLNGFGSNLLGYGAEEVVRAAHNQLDEGYELGPQTPLAGEVAALVCELTGLDRAAFCNTGSEAVMGAMRMARTVTGRSTIALFAGSYHGIFDEVIVRGTRTYRAIPAAPGILAEGVKNVVVLEYGAQESLDYIREKASELAAVLVEPVQSRRPDLQPRAFLHELRAITEEAGTALIFDEVITGFRTHPGGAQAHFGVKADIATYGKVVGGGMPIGVIAGTRKFMDALDGGAWQFGDDSVPTVGVTYFAGTFVRHPLAMAAARAVLLHLKERGPALQEELNARTDRLAFTLNAHFELVGVPLKIKHFASLWKALYLEDQPHGDLLFYALRDRGVHIYDGFPCFLTTAHTDADVDRVIAAFRESVTELQECGFLPAPPAHKAPSMVLDASRPPVPDAKLGRDPDGNPAWYVPDVNAPGRYVKFEA